MPLTSAPSEDSLLATSAAYDKLEQHLTTLPRKLTHPGLIPLAPRLYMPGELVRTNEILVLLGRSGGASYFAERTAWQALQIVRRRRGHVDRGLRDILDADLPVVERPLRRLKQVTFRDPVVCASPLEKAQPSCLPSLPLPLQLDQSDNLTALTSDSTSAQLDPTALDSTQDLSQEYWDVLRAAELDEDSSDDDMETYAPSPSNEYDQFLSESHALQEEDHTIQHFNDDIDAPGFIRYSDRADSQEKGPNPALRTEKPASNDAAIPTVDATESTTQKSMNVEWHDALKSAQQQVREEGVVNLMEFYGDDSDTPTHVELPPHYKPNEDIDFETDTSKYLDLTHKREEKNVNSSAVPRDYVGFLQEEARKEEISERQDEAEKSMSSSEKTQRRLQEEKKEFGAGFAKGFFGSAKPKKKPAKQSAEVKEQPAPDMQTSAPSERQETSAVQERVVERKSSRKSSRRHRTPRMPHIPEVVTVDSFAPEEVGEEELAGHFMKGDDDDIATDGPQLSRFRQLRRLQKTEGGREHD